MEGLKGRKFFAREPSSLVLPAAAGGGLKISVGIFPKIGSDFVQKVPPVGKRSVWLARYAGSPVDFKVKVAKALDISVENKLSLTL